MHKNGVRDKSRKRKYIQNLYIIFWKYAYGNVHMIPYYFFFLRFSILNLKILFLQLEVVMKFSALHN